MKAKTPLIIGLVATLGLAACDPYANPGTNYNSQSGAIGGALIGGAIGASSGDGKLAKAAAGAIVGGALGGLLGNQLDKQAAELQGSMDSRVQIIRQGNQLIVRMPQDVLFATDSATLRSDLQGDIGALATSLNRYPNTRIEVIGHTDNTGAAAHNQDLSQRRAAAAANVLMQAGVNPGRISSYGRGEDQPIASNLTDAGRAQNRRVEFIIQGQ